MFTVKVFRKDSEGRDRVHIYEAHSVDVMRDAEGLKVGEVEILFREPSGVEPAIVVTYDEPTEGYTPCHTVVIENMDGNTTEVVRAVRRKG